MIKENIQLIKQEHYQRLKWKNGLGRTEQIDIFPEDSLFHESRFTWRMSTAPVTESGPFSLFPGYQRLFIVIEGPGINLYHEKNNQNLIAFTPYHFAGDLKTRGDLINGSIQDFNFIYRPDLVSIHYEIIKMNHQEPLSWVTKEEFNFLFVAQGSLQSSNFTIKKRETLKIKQGMTIEFLAIETGTIVIKMAISSIVN